jgi:hypothetical protein
MTTFLIGLSSVVGLLLFLYLLGLVQNIFSNEIIPYYNIEENFLRGVMTFIWFMLIGASLFGIYGIGLLIKTLM